MLFSQRIGIKPVRNTLQIESMDDGLRNLLWNRFLQIVWQNLDEVDFVKNADKEWKFFRILWIIYKWRLDEMPHTFYEIHEILKNKFFHWQWDEVYDFIQIILDIYKDTDKESEKRIHWKVCINLTLEQEKSAYRFVGDLLTPITNEEEIKAIERAMFDTSKNPLTHIQKHIHTALEKLADRKNPDYRNSIKESISAVEAMARIIVGKPKATLGEALKILDGKIDVHPALKAGFEKIYGYTSDESGIRHAMLDDARQIDFADAKYMMVSCSAFINYLIMKSDKAGIKVQ